MIRRLLVANRAEIASRVFTTCRRLGIETVAVHSDADAGLPYVAEADYAVALPGSSPSETYLRVDLLIAAARQAGADAVHPGYGFGSESADFARAVLEAGLTWIGPSPESIELMGSKVRAKERMAAAGVPVLTAPDEPGAHDLPLLVKASAGGGGRGMRVVRSLAELPAEIAAAQAEAASAFGDGTVFVEPYVEHGRHVEVQVWGDHAGEHVSVLGLRDCSLQRRHQKVIEEAPPPGLDEQRLDAIAAAARTAAGAIGYVGAGTVEFLVDADDLDRFWFLEMNTRLQVEHPVTEALTGLDLVEWQLLAATDPSARAPEPASLVGPGHAIEVRLYAESPAAGWQPQSGVLSAFEVPGVTARFEQTEAAAGLRLDAGFAAGDEVSPHYDAMLAKVICWDADRDRAARRLAVALRRARVHGLATNLDLLVGLLESPAFLAGDVSTDLLADADEVSRLASSGLATRLAATVAAAALAERSRAERTVQRGVPVAWRNVASAPQRTAFVPADTAEPTAEEIEVLWYPTRDGGYDVVSSEVAIVAAGTDRVTVERAGVRSTYRVEVVGDRVEVDGPEGHAALRIVPRFTDPSHQHPSGSLLAPMPGSVTSVLAAVGDRVEAGTPVLVLEAMKMQHPVTAPEAGVLTELPVEAGQQVSAGDLLAVVDS